MADTLEAARESAEAVRFADDDAHPGSAMPASASGIRRHLAMSGLQVSNAVTPALSRSLRKAESHLGLPMESLTAFVEASPDIQAMCYAGDPGHCTIAFTSTLVDLLTPEELTFVVGHELGHFLLQHSITKMDTSGGCIEIFMKMRAQEISADRVGLLACRSLDVAIQAMMKTVSGLSERHLRFDVGAFLSQINELDGQPSLPHTMSTHPSIVVRCRALLWFSIGLKETATPTVDGAARIQLDERVRQDLARFVDGPARQRLRDLEADFAMWLAAQRIATDGVFDREEQDDFEKEFGKDTLESLKRFLSSHSSSEALAVITSRVNEARERLQGAAPSSFDVIAARIEEQLSRRFGPAHS